MVKEIDKEDVHTVCPHCLKKINLVWVCKLESIIGIRYAYFCSECQKNLGISHIKDFHSCLIKASIENHLGNSSNSF
ncbi:MAG: hypothetical protein M1480_13655 [Bacteroidetes bacterium]|nr:hypothetical protein [Bacteroidota bacterium]